MFSLTLLDDILRRLISIVFRLLLIAYGFVILSSFNNTLPKWAYFSTTIIYAVFYILLYRKKKIWSKLRLLNDYIFISVFAWQKPIDNFLIITFFLLPIFNAPNHSGDKRSIVLYIFAAFSIIATN